MFIFFETEMKKERSGHDIPYGGIWDPFVQEIENNYFIYFFCTNIFDFFLQVYPCLPLPLPLPACPCLPPACPLPAPCLPPACPLPTPAYPMPPLAPWQQWQCCHPVLAPHEAPPATAHTVASHRQVRGRC